MCDFLVENLGLMLNVGGTLLIAASIGKIPKGFGGTTTADDGKIYHFAYVTHPILFKLGLGLIGIGFFLQLNWQL